MTPPRRQALLSLRTTLIIALATVIALAAAVLTWVQSHSWPTATLAGAGAWAGAVTFLNSVIDHGADAT